MRRHQPKAAKSGPERDFQNPSTANIGNRVKLETSVYTDGYERAETEVVEEKRSGKPLFMTVETDPTV